MVNLTGALEAMNDEMHDLLVILSNVCGFPQSLGSGWGGGVGNKPEDVAAVFKRGNVRERISHLDLFIENVLGDKVFNNTYEALDEIYEKAEAAGIDSKVLRARREEVLGVPGRVGTAGLEIGEDGRPLQAVKAKHCRWIATETHSLATSTKVDCYEGDASEGGFKEGMDEGVGDWAKRLKQEVEQN